MRMKQKIRYMYVMLLLAVLCLVPKGMAQAAAYEVTVTDESVTCTYNGERLTNAYAAVLKKDDQYQVIKPCTKKSSIYYLSLIHI